MTPSPIEARHEDRPVACTIIARNYLAHARCLAESFLAHHPGGSVYVLLVDRVDEAFDPARETFTTLVVEDLDIPQLHEMVLRYDLMELCTAVKPFLLMHLVCTLGHRQVCYLDPDIIVYRHFDEVWSQLQQSAIVLTPHLLAPTDDRFDPDEAHILTRGTYNLGFIGICDRVQTRQFLRWWQDRLTWGCMSSPERGLFVDQKWIDLVPGYFSDVHVLRHPGYNAAYWDLGARRISRKGSNFLVNGERLAFFHFSGYNPHAPLRVSRYQNRATFVTRPDIQPLFDDYRARLLVHGVDAAGRLPNALLRTTPPMGSLRHMRSLLRNVRLRLPRRWRLGPGENDVMAREFATWCVTPEVDAPPGRGLLTPVMAALYRENPSLAMVFPEPRGNDEIIFALWFISRARRRHGVHWRFRLPVAWRLLKVAALNPPGFISQLRRFWLLGIALHRGRHPLLPERGRLHL